MMSTEHRIAGHRIAGGSPEARAPGFLQTLRAEEPVRIGPVGIMTPRAGSLEAWNACLNPGDAFRHPREVLAHPGLSVGDKRTILASWASDAQAVESCPGLRCLVGCRAEPVPLDAILDALQALDAAEGPEPILN